MWASLGFGSLLSVSVAYGTQTLDDLTTHYLLLAAAPIRDVKPGDQLNVLFIIVDDLNVALGSYFKSEPRPQYATVKTPNQHAQ